MKKKDTLYQKDKINNPSFRKSHHSINPILIISKSTLKFIDDEAIIRQRSNNVKVFQANIKEQAYL